MGDLSQIEIPIPVREPKRARERGGCFRGCLRVAVSVTLASILSCCGFGYWMTASPPAVYGEIGTPEWRGRSEHDVFTELRRSYLDEAEPLLRQRCYSCHTGPSFERDVPIVVEMTGLLRSMVDTHVRDGVRALDLGWGFPFARDGQADLRGLPDALGKLEKSVADGTMPPPSFVLAHPSAVLTSDEQVQILGWVRGAQARLGLRSRVGANDAERAVGLLADRCGGCHGVGSSTFPHDIESREALEDQGFLDPDRPDASRLMIAVTSGEMPKDDSPRLTPSEVDLLGRWAAGDIATAETLAEPLGPVEVRRRVLEDLQSLPPGKRRLARYVSADHLTTVRRDAFGRFEAADALATALYTASRSPTLVPPVDIADGRIYRILLSDFGWDASTFAEVEQGYPLAFDPRGGGAELGDGIRGLTGAVVDVIALDWLVHAITQPPLYPVLVDLPETLDEFEREHGVDRCAGAKDGSAARAGFRRSGVSLNNRVVERQADGAYWLSYDFARSDGQGDIFANPLGPECTGLTPAFKQDGGEVIFALPNGWQGFALVDGQGRRLDVDAPMTIVSDRGAPITNPRSCLGCHANGLLPVQDEVRRAKAADPKVLDAVRTVYSETSAMAANVAADTDRFRVAKVAGGVSPLRTSDPVGAVVSTFLDSADAGELAAFLGVTEDSLVEVMEGTAFDRKVLTANFGTVVEAAHAGRFRPAESTLPFDDLDRRAAQPDAGVIEPESGYRLVRVTMPTSAAFVGEEVTQGLWRAVLDEDAPVDCFRGVLTSMAVDMRVVGDDLPVSCVGLADAARFANALSERDGLVPVYVAAPGALTWREGANGYRLPTLQEWRAAAGTTPFAGAAAEDEVCSVANVLGRADLADLMDVVGFRRPFACDENPRVLGPARIASFDVAPSGLHDLTGNAAELVWTAPPEARLDIDQPATLVGGSWLSGPSQASSSVVRMVPPDERSPESGFRLARDVPSGVVPSKTGPGRLVVGPSRTPTDEEKAQAALRAVLFLMHAPQPQVLPNAAPSHTPAPVPWSDPRTDTDWDDE